MKAKYELIQKYIQAAYDKLYRYSKNHLMTEPREGYEHEWKDTKKEIDLLTSIYKELEKVENAPAANTLKRMQYLVKSILSYSVNINVKKKDKVNLGVKVNDSKELEIQNCIIEASIGDNVKHKILAVFNFDIVNDNHFILKDYQLF